MGKQWETLFFGAPKSLQMVTALMKLKDVCSLGDDQPRQHFKKERHYFANKGPSSQGYDFSSGHVRMWELDYKESWVLKNWCFWAVMFETTPESPMDCKEIHPVHPKGDQSWVFVGRTDVEAETNTLATWCKGLTHLKRPWCWERLKAGEGDDRGWDDWMASPTWWTWDWVNSGSWWWTGKPGVLQSMGSQRVGQDWTTELTELNTLVYQSGSQQEIAVILRVGVQGGRTKTLTFKI